LNKEYIKTRAACGSGPEDFLALRGACGLDQAALLRKELGKL